MKMSHATIIGIIVAVVSIVVLELVARPANDASLLLALLFWMGPLQGAVALAAATHLSRGRWLDPLRDTLVDLWPILALFPLLFAFYGRDLSAYGWSAHPTSWLTPGFLVARNALAQTIVFILAALLARALKNGSDVASRYAVAYLSAFVMAQSLAAIDFVMSFEFPFISTMFGPLYFVESFWSGTIVAAVLAACSCLRPRDLMRAAATLMFGFSLLWAGLFYAQYLTIWYGGLPEETSFFFRRLPYAEMFWYFICAAFVAPFPVLLARRMRSTPYVVLVAAVLIVSGLIVERLWHLLPVVGVSPWLATGETLLIGLPVLVSLATGTRR